MQGNEGNVVLVAASGTGFINWLAQADLVISVLVGVLSAVGIIYSIIWHRVRIGLAKAKEQANVTSNRQTDGRAARDASEGTSERN